MPSTGRHLFSYRFEGRRYGFDIPAASEEEARARLKALMWASYEGELVASAPLPAAPSWWRAAGRLLARR